MFFSKKMRYFKGWSIQVNPQKWNPKNNVFPRNVYCPDFWQTYLMGHPSSTSKMKANLSQKKGFSEMKSGNNFFWRYSRWKTATQRKSFESVGRLKYFFFSAAIFFFGSNIDSSRVEARTSEMKLFLSFLSFLFHLSPNFFLHQNRSSQKIGSTFLFDAAATFEQRCFFLPGTALLFT